MTSVVDVVFFMQSSSKASSNPMDLEVAKAFQNHTREFPMNFLQNDLVSEGKPEEGDDKGYYEPVARPIVLILVCSHVCVPTPSPNGSFSRQLLLDLAREKGKNKAK